MNELWLSICVMLGISMICSGLAYGLFTSIGEGIKSTLQAELSTCESELEQYKATTETAISLGNKCADMAMIVIDERDACLKRESKRV